MSRYEWVLFLHVTGAFLVLGGAVIAGVFSIAALRRERPSEIAAVLRLTRWGVTSVSIGVLMTLVFGLWLVHIVGYGWGDTWIVLALVLWVLSSALGGIGGRRDKETRQLAERLAAEGDAPAPELRARLRDPLALGLSWGSGLVAVAILGLMIWKPGASIASPRHDSWNLPLFLHVFGATVLVGGMASAAVAARASVSAAVPRALPFRILLLVAIPSWVLMRFAGQWIDSKEDVKGDPTWLGIGFTVGDLGVLVLLVAVGVTWWAAKRPALRWPRQTATGLAFLYLVALAVAWWAMSAKPGS
jgi:uncharacterized membrane protein